MSKFSSIMAALASLPGVEQSMASAEYTRLHYVQLAKQADALAKKQAVREQIRARRAAKGKP